MFTGIVEEIGIVKLPHKDRLTIMASDVVKGMKPGDSIAVNGACLTVISIDGDSFSADIMPETLQRTNLGGLHSGDEVNLERAVLLGGRLGGHLVQGHVDSTGRVVLLTPQDKAFLVRFVAPIEVMRYVVEKGFIAVDGVSLTVANRATNMFTISLVPYTQKHTTLGSKKVGDLVNLEADIVAKYIEQLIPKSNSGITLDFLAEQGFLKTVKEKA